MENKYYKMKVKTEYGEGDWIVEVDEDGWAVRQAEIYKDEALFSPEDMSLFDEKLPEGFGKEEYIEITKVEFENMWDIGIKEK